jgi:hypothetical protein
MPSKRLECTLEDLETNNFATGLLWRGLRDIGRPARLAELEDIGCSLAMRRHAIQRLVSYGWAEKCGVHKRQMRYRAVIEQRPRIRHDKAALKLKLSACIRKASKGRRTALVRDMAQALFELEKDLQEIRDSL